MQILITIYVTRIIDPVDETLCMNKFNFVNNILSAKNVPKLLQYSNFNKCEI